MKGFFRRLFKTILFLVVAYFVFIIGLHGYKYIKNMLTADMELHANGLIYDENAANERLKNIPSDIEGWSKYDKKKAGLITKEEADSDGDGLTDKEEIEIYDSDPTKVSTAGDLYSDNYKVANGMDINKYYEFQGDPSFVNNKCEEVILTATSAENLSAWVVPKINDEIQDYSVFRTYDIYYYEGPLSIDLKTIASENGVKEEDLVVLLGGWGDENLKKIQFEKSGSIITLKDNLERKNRYTIIVAKADSDKASDNPMSNFSFNGNDVDDVVGQDFLFVHFLPVLNVFDKSRMPHMYYVPAGDKTMDRLIESYLREFAYDALDGKVEGITEDNIKQVSSTQMKVIKAMLEPFSGCRVDSIDDLNEDSPNFTMNYLFCLYNDNEAIPASQYNIYRDKETKVMYSNESNTGFIPDINEFCFTNFGSEFSVGGNCAGIAFYTAYVFNNKEGIPTGGYTSNRYNNGAEQVYWDITNDEENNPLFTSSLASYKNTHFTESHYKNGETILTDLTEGEEEYVKMIGALWAKTNDVMLENYDAVEYNPAYGYYSWDMIEEIKTYLDNNKILCLALRDNGGYGHVVNIVGYREFITATKGSEEVKIVFNLYDNIFPLNHSRMYGITERINPVLIVEKSHCNSGYKDSFTYYYRPDGKDYEYSSTNAFQNELCFIIMDTDFNVLNDKY